MTIFLLQRLNKATGQNWFGPGEMAVFSTQIETEVMADRYFVTSEVIPGQPRRFTVRTFDNKGRVFTANRFYAYDSLREAVAAIQRETTEPAQAGLATDGVSERAPTTQRPAPPQQIGAPAPSTSTANPGGMQARQQ